MMPASVSNDLTRFRMMPGCTGGTASGSCRGLLANVRTVGEPALLEVQRPPRLGRGRGIVRHRYGLPSSPLA